MTATYYRPSIHYFWHGNSSHSWQAIVRFLLARIIEAVVWYYMFCGVLLDSLSLFFAFILYILSQHHYHQSVQFLSATK